MKMKTKIGLISALTVFLILSSAMMAHGAEATTLYAHSESVSIDSTPYKALKTTACDGPEAALTYQGNDSGVVTLGNSSAIQLSSISSQIKALKDTTWTFTYYAVANSSSKATLLVSIYITNSSGDTEEEHAFKAQSSSLTNTNASYTGTYAFVTTYTIRKSDYLKIMWYINKSDTTALTVTLYLDVAATPTKIEGIEYDMDAPVITIISPTSTTYEPDTTTPWPYTSTVPLTFNIDTANATLTWVKYSLNGEANVTIGTKGNITLTGLATDVTYTITVYANNTSNQIGNSSTITFSFHLPSTSIHTILPYFFIAIGLIGLTPIIITIVVFIKMELDTKTVVSIVVADIIIVMAILIILTFISAVG